MRIMDITTRSNALLTDDGMSSSVLSGTELRALLIYYS